MTKHFSAKRLAVVGPLCGNYISCGICDGLYCFFSDFSLCVKLNVCCAHQGDNKELPEACVYMAKHFSVQKLGETVCGLIRTLAY